MPADRHQPERRKEFIDFGNRPATDECERAAHTVADTRQGFGQFGWDDNFSRSWRDVEQSAIDIEQKRQTIEVVWIK